MPTVEVQCENAQNGAMDAMPNLCSLFLDYDPSLQQRIENHINPDSRNAEQIIRNELNTYRGLPLELIPDKDVLAWWGKNKDILPLLYKLARFILAIPASSAAAEGTFSLAGLIDADNKASLNSEMIEAILILKCNKDIVDNSIGDF